MTPEIEFFRVLFSVWILAFARTKVGQDSACEAAGDSKSTAACWDVM
jgi:hypothetical protein